MQIKQEKNSSEHIINGMGGRKAVTRKTLKSCKALLRVIARQPLLPILQRASLVLVLWGAGYIVKAGHTRSGDFADEKRGGLTCFSNGKVSSAEGLIWNQSKLSCKCCEPGWPDVSSSRHLRPGPQAFGNDGSLPCSVLTAVEKPRDWRQLGDSQRTGLFHLPAYKAPLNRQRGVPKRCGVGVEEVSSVTRVHWRHVSSHTASPVGEGQWGQGWMTAHHLCCSRLCKVSGLICWFGMFFPRYNFYSLSHIWTTRIEIFLYFFPLRSTVFI